MKAAILGIVAGASFVLGPVRAWAEEPRPPPMHVLTAPEKGPAPSAQPFIANIGELTSRNSQYRHVIYTGRLSQLALMSIPPGSDIGYESHEHVEQILFVQSGRGRVVIDGKKHEVGPGDVVVATPGVGHDIVNTGDEPLKIYTIYTPPNHIPGREQPTKSAAEADHADEEFGRKAGSRGK